MSGFRIGDVVRFKDYCTSGVGIIVDDNAGHERCKIEGFDFVLERCDGDNQNYDFFYEDNLHGSLTRLFHKEDLKEFFETLSYSELQTGDTEEDI